MAIPIRTPAEKIAFIKRRLRAEGQTGSMTFLAARGEYSLIPADSTLAAAAVRHGFEATDAGSFATKSPLSAAKFANLADEAAIAALEWNKINVDSAIRDAEIVAKRRITLTANRAADAREENYDTFDAWTDKGRTVRKGEKASKHVGTEKLFHFSQTFCARELFSEMRSQGLLTAKSWQNAGRQILTGESPVVRENIEFFAESQTRAIDDAPSDTDTFAGWKSRGRRIRKGEKAGEGRVFRLDQTFDPKVLDEEMAERGLRSRYRWNDQGREVVEGQAPSEIREMVEFYSESQTAPA